MGGAIFAELGNKIKIINSTFVKNHAQCNSYLAKVCFGGVLHSENVFASTNIKTQVVAVNSLFSSNRAPYGGAISVHDSTFNITSSKFFSNSAGEYDGGEDIRSSVNATVGETETQGGGSGGVIFLMYNGTVIVENSQFYNNTAVLNGGVLYVALQSVTSISKSEFWNNNVRGRGGVIYLVNSSTAIISNRSKFHYNAALYDVGAGGVLAAIMQSAVNISDSDFVNNLGLFAGGVLNVHNVSLNINRSFFFNNTGWYQGGVLDIYNCFSVAISECKFHNNRVNHSGGGWCYYNTRF